MSATSSVGRSTSVPQQAGGAVGFDEDGAGRGSRSSGLAVAQTSCGGDAQIAGGRLQTAMAEQELNRPDIGTGFQKVYGTTGNVCGVFGAGITASMDHGFWRVTV
jgi:hypothetical protein